MPERIWAFEDYPDSGANPRGGVWCDEQSETPECAACYVRADTIPDAAALIEQGRQQGLRDMMEHACSVLDANSEYDQRMCCDGRMCGCQGTSVYQMMQHFIRNDLIDQPAGGTDDQSE